MFKLILAILACITVAGCNASTQTLKFGAAPFKNPALAFGGRVAPVVPNVHPVQATWPAGPQVTYLINGLASNVASIGYGFTNLSKKIPNSELYNYASPVESSTYILSKVRREILQARRRNPNLRINLIGISFGANIVTVIATDLKRSGIEVNYMATIEGPALLPVSSNVIVADNFSCTNLDCFRTKLRPALGNRTSIISNHKVKSSHIPMGDHHQVHKRILKQISAPN